MNLNGITKRSGGHIIMSLSTDSTIRLFNHSFLYIIIQFQIRQQRGTKNLGIEDVSIKVKYLI